MTPTTRLPGIPAVARVFDQFVEQNQIAGAVSLISRQGEIIHLDAIGVSDLQTERPLQTDDLFWVASMTKPISAAALLLLLDEERVSLDDPVENYLPEFAELSVASGEKQRRPNRSVTIRDLLRHTHGLAEIPTPHSEATLAEHVWAITREPLQFEPGSCWKYGDAGFNTVGRVVEVISGECFQDVLRSRFFEPLGMKDTTFFPSEKLRERVAKMYGPNAERTALVETPRVLLPGDLWSPTRTVFPGGGLFSTATDMLRFNQMLANGGAYEGRRYLSEKAVHNMTCSQTGELTTAFEGGAYGLGLHLIERPAGEFAMVSPGTWGHDGASGTSGFYDPQRKLLMIHMIQRTGLWGPPHEGHAIRQAFQEAVISGLR